MKKNKQKTIKSFEELAGAISFGSLGDKAYHGTNSVFNSLVDELEEHNKKVKQRIKNYDRL